MGILHLSIAALVVPWLVGGQGQVDEAYPGNPEPVTVTVVITETGYHPSTLTVRPGDVIRFVQMDGLRVHNVEFFGVPAGARMVPEYVPPVGDAGSGTPDLPPLRVGPDLFGPGHAYEVVIGEHLPEGAYSFGCSRHEKMRGLLVVWDFEELP